MRKTTRKLVIIMSLIGALLGCKTNSPMGPDFSKPIHKTIHIEPGVIVTYEIPGNMSQTMNFAERYVKDSPRTLYFEGGGDLHCEDWHWRKSCDVDGAMWDYRTKGDVTLNLRIELLPVESATEADSHIKSLYDNFLNGPDGLNTAVRGRNAGIADEDLGPWIRPVPTDFKWQLVGDNRVLTWSDGGTDRGKTTEYYAFVIAEDMLLNFAFTYAISSKSAKERELAREKLPEDIESFMRRVEVKR